MQKYHEDFKRAPCLGAAIFVEDIVEAEVADWWWAGSYFALGGGSAQA
jgi:hypothetical protein